jgi:hypothetical protein
MLLPFQLMVGWIHDRLFDSQDVLGIRLYFQPGMEADEKQALARKLRGALEVLRRVDPENAKCFFAHFTKLYAVMGLGLKATSSGMPQLPKGAVLNNTDAFVASLLIHYVPTARAGLIRCGYQLIDPVPVHIAQRELQLDFLRKAKHSDPRTDEYIAAQERNLEYLREQLRE